MIADFFSNVFGHTSVKQELKRALDLGSLPHALLFSGPEAVGKRAMAQALAGEILTRGANNECRNLCLSGQHADFHVLAHDPEKRDIPVDLVRELINVLNLKPYMGNKSVAIIEDAHRLSLPACNALLKTLEEPSGFSHLILISSNSHRLPETILSRCQTISFGLLSSADLKNVLGTILEDELKQQDLLLLNGSLEALELSNLFDRRSLKALNQKELRQHVQNTLGEYQSVSAKLKALLTGGRSIAQAVSLATELAADFNPRIVWTTLRAVLRQSMLEAAPSRQNRLARLIQESAVAEKLCTERSANLQLQLTPLMLGALEA